MEKPYRPGHSSNAAIYRPQKDDDAYNNADSPLRQMMDRMMVQMDAMQMIRDPDLDFARMMMVHHQGAVEMAQAEVLYGQVPMMRAMAQMITGQQQEIARFQAWLSGHD